MNKYWQFLQDHTGLVAVAVVLISIPIAIKLVDILTKLMPSGKPNE